MNNAAQIYYLRLRCRLVLPALMIIFLACNSGENSESAKAVKTVSRGKDQVEITIKTKEGATFRRSVIRGQLPGGWPDDIPVIDGGTIGFSQTDPHGSFAELTLQVRLPSRQVMAYYINALKKNNWLVKPSVINKDLRTLRADKAGKELLVKFNETDGLSSIHMVLRPGLTAGQ